MVAGERRLLICDDGGAAGADAQTLGTRLAEALAARPVVVELPVRALCSEVEAQRPLAAVVGSAHRGPIGRALSASVGATLLGSARCPVAVAPRGLADAGGDLLRLGVAFDGSRESEAALSQAIAFALYNNSSLTVLTAIEEPAYAYSAPFTGGAGAVAAGRRHEHEMATVLDRAIARVPAALPVERRLLRGPAVAKLASAAEPLDLLFVGSHGRGPLQRLLLGSVSRGLVRAGRCPVLVVPRESGDDPMRLADLEGAEAGLAARGRETA